MASLTLTGVRKSFGDTTVLQGIDLAVNNGEFVVFVGPSGCGKSTLLRLICGLDDVTSGTIAIDNETVNDVPPAKRGIAMVFQSYALYPHMTVKDNMAFSMKLRNTPVAELNARVARAAEILSLTPLLDRFPRQLSGGQRQRVAMGRAIVRDPQVFLFDEPLSNLDAKLRVQMRTEIKELHQRLKTTTVYVTHDQIEAMTMADKIVVMHDGIVEQIGAPLELYRRPANMFVARFIGSPRMNMLPGSSLGEQAAFVGVRPEHVRLVPASAGRVHGEVALLEHLGSDLFAHIAVAGATERMIARLDGQEDLRTGAKVGLGFAAEHLHRFGTDGCRLTETSPLRSVG